MFVLALVAGLAGCGGSTAGEAVKERIEQLSVSEYEQVWETLHPAHQAIVSREKFVECGKLRELQRSPFVDQLTIEGERTEKRLVPEVGVVDVRVVEALMVQGDTATTNEFEMLKVDGDWRWLLSQDVLDDFAAGECP